MLTISKTAKPIAVKGLALPMMPKTRVVPNTALENLATGVPFFSVYPG